MKPEEMRNEDWHKWIEYFTDPFEVEFWQKRGWFIGLLTRDDVEEELLDLLTKEKGWNPDKIPENVINDVVERIYELVVE